jgi:hypothetical protein
VAFVGPLAVMGSFDWLFTPGSLNLALAIVAVAVYMAIQQLFARPDAQQPEAVVPRTATRVSVARPLVRKRCLGDTPLAKSSHKYFMRYPTISIDCRSLFPESEAVALDNGVNLDASTVEVIREASNTSKVYLILHDAAPYGLLEAIVLSSLEMAGVVGEAAGQIPRHRVLVCSTTIGKVAIVRQLEAAQHIECDAHVHDELSRFSVPQWLVKPPGMDGQLVDRVRAFEL